MAPRQLVRAGLLKTASTPWASTMAAPVAELLAIILRRQGSAQRTLQKP